MPVEAKCDPRKVSEWLNDEIEGECRPCALATAVPLYQETLENAGEKKQLEKLDEAFADETDPVGKIAQFMDDVKDVVDPTVAAQLREIDCEAQSSHPVNEEE